MRCEQVQELLAGQSYGERVSAEAQAHLEVCQICQRFAVQGEQLDAVLRVDEPTEPRPGFDTRFFARLEELKTRGAQPVWARLRWWLVALVPMGAAAVAFFIMSSPREPSFETELALAVELELFENYEVVKELADVEAYEVLAFVDIAELERVEAEGRP